MALNLSMPGQEELKPRITVFGVGGAGGNVGAVVYAQYMLRSGASLEQCFLYYGVAVAVIGLMGFGIRFSEQAEADARREFEPSAGGVTA